MSEVKSESAAKLDESAAKLDESAARLNEGAAKLHEVAVQLREEASEPASWSLSAATQAQLERARRLLRGHPLGTVATIAVVAAFVEVELAIGILVGLGATALLTTRSGSATRQRFVSRGRIALNRARIAMLRQRATRPSRSNGNREGAAAAPPS
jgi:hypothetical protein